MTYRVGINYDVFDLQKVKEPMCLILKLKEEKELAIF
jgi:hypothetical protein